MLHAYLLTDFGKINLLGIENWYRTLCLKHLTRYGALHRIIFEELCIGKCGEHHLHSVYIA